MTAKPRRCIRCQPPADGEVLSIEDRGWLCDTHMELVNHPQRIGAPRALGSPPLTTDRPKPKRNRKRKSTAVATAVLLLIASAAGCTVTHDTQSSWGKLHRETQSAVQIAPHLNVDFQPSKTPPPVK